MRVQYYWDFFGPDAGRTAGHFREHLDQFLVREGILGCSTGVMTGSANHEAAWCVAPEAAQPAIERALRPRRRSELGPEVADKIVVFGNSGSGKTTWARALAKDHGHAHLDLDTVVWEPERIAVPRAPEAVRADLHAFMARHDRWVMEGCYGDIVDLVTSTCTELVFLNPGEAVCRAHCIARPWEPHKYSSKDEQDQRLPMLLEWVSGYYTRTDACSLAHHRRTFDAFHGAKRELTG